MGQWHCFIRVPGILWYSQWLTVLDTRLLDFFIDPCVPCPCQVTNVDDEGVELGSGVMELTQSELVLHLHRREAVRWPYLCLRRYGYDSNLFSFESGRRCQTGQGEYQPLSHAGMGTGHLGQVLGLDVTA